MTVMHECTGHLLEVVRDVCCVDWQLVRASQSELIDRTDVWLRGCMTKPDASNEALESTDNAKSINARTVSAIRPLYMSRVVLSQKIGNSKSLKVMCTHCHGLVSHGIDLI